MSEHINILSINYEHYIYIFFAIFISYRLATKTDNKKIAFIIIFYIMAQPPLYLLAVFHTPSFLPLDLHPLRVWLFVLGIIIANEVYTKKIKKIKSKKPVFEYFLYLYFASVTISLLLNFHRININTFLISSTSILFFIMMYIFAKRFVTLSVLDAIFKAILITIIFSSIIAIYQFVFDITFLNGGESQDAFGNTMRSNGIFSQEYILGYELSFATILILSKYKNKFLLYCGLPLIVIALITTFNRMNWVIFIVSVFLFFSISKSWKPIILTGYFSVMICCFVLLTMPDLIPNTISDYHYKAFINNRLVADTSDGRIRGYRIALNAIFTKYPMGIGSRKSIEYNMLFGDREGSPVTLHNGFLDAGIHYGIISMILFACFILSLLHYFKNGIIKNHIYKIPFFIVAIWIMANLINSNINFGTHFIILAAIICGSFVSQNNSICIENKSIGE